MLEKCAHSSFRSRALTCELRGGNRFYAAPVCMQLMPGFPSIREIHKVHTPAFPSEGGWGEWAPLHKEVSGLPWEAWACPLNSPVCVLCYVVCTMFLTQLGFLRSEMMNWDQVHMCRYKMILSTKTYLTILRVKKQLPRVLSLFGTNEWKQTTQQIKWTERERWIP